MALNKPVELLYDGSKPPVSILSVIELCSSVGQQVISKSVNDCTTNKLLFYNGEELHSDELIIRYLARLHDVKQYSNASDTLRLYGNNPLESTQIDYFIDICKYINNKDTLIDYVTHLNKHLVYRTFLVGEHITIADLLIWQSITYNVRFNAFSKQMHTDVQYVDINRWYTHIQSMDILSSSMKLYDELKQSKQEKYHSSSTTGSFNIELKGEKNQRIVTRFPPEPSGYLHIGHAKAALLNAFYAHENSDGTLIVRFDDTNPNKEKNEYIDSILNDLKTLEIKYDKLTWTSDYFDIIIQYGKQLIESGHAYVDDTPVDVMREQRMDGIESHARNNSVSENIRLFNEMQAGSEIGLKCCVRAKIDMSLPNKCMRDPTIFRCKIDVPHHRTGTKYKMYPIYDFAVPIVDSLEGITHAMRTTEYTDRNPQYQWFLQALNLRTVHILEYARLTFSFTLMSKRKLQWFVDTGRVDNWYDPRFPTVQGIIRRGMTVRAIHEFMHSQGFSRNVNVQEWDKIWTMNKKIIDPVAHRYTALNKTNLCKIILTSTNNDLPNKLEYISVQLHPKHPDIGNKLVGRSNILYIEQVDAASIVDNEEITLMSWGNCIVNRIDKSSDNIITTIHATLNLAGDVKKTDKKLTFIASDGTTDNDYVPLTLVEFDHLITVVKLEDHHNIEDVINPHSRIESYGIGEPAMRQCKQGQIIQLNRKGFYYIDKIGSGSQSYILHSVPDGRLKEGTLEYKWAKQREADAGENKKNKK